MDTLQCEKCKENFNVYLDLVEELGRLYCPYCGNKEVWE